MDFAPLNNPIFKIRQEQEQEDIWEIKKWISDHRVASKFILMKIKHADIKCHRHNIFQL